MPSGREWRFIDSAFGLKTKEWLDEAQKGVSVNEGIPIHTHLVVSYSFNSIPHRKKSSN